MGKLIRIALGIAVALFAADAARGAELNVPARVIAGQEVSISTSGSGSATLYVSGPNHSTKQEVRLGEPVTLRAEDVRAAGRYLAVLREGGNSSSKWFTVVAAEPAQISFLARPSRVPVARPDVISGVAFVFDDYRNMVLAPTGVNFELSVAGTKMNRTVQSRNGVAYLKLPSASKEGAAQFVASAGKASERRVVQQVASEPCTLRVSSRRTPRAIVLETAPIRDCSGNAVPDGAIVTFIHVGQKGRSTIDARIKKGVASAQLPLGNPGRVSVASGVVVGNEIMVGGQE